MSRFDGFTTEGIRNENISLAFCVVDVIRSCRGTDGQIMLGVFQHSFQKREAKNNKLFCSGIIISYSMVLHIIHEDILLIARICPHPENTTQLANNGAYYM